MDDVRIDRTIETDVLVIGGGGAACRAALSSAECGARTVLAVKGCLGRCGATTAPGRGVAWQVADECSSETDSPDAHLANILDAGLGMADPELARILAHELPAITDEIEGWGLPFVPDATGRARHHSAYSCFGDEPRAHCILNSGHGHAGDIVVTLMGRMEGRDISVHEGVFVIDLIHRDGVCHGAMAIDSNGDYLAYHAGAVVMAAGGARQIFSPKGGALIDTTGDGYAMALRAGAMLANMEFAQFMLGLDPLAQVLDVPGFVWALYPTLRNARGQEVLSRYLPAGVSSRQVMDDRTLHHPFSCRDASGWLDIAIAAETAATGSAWVDFADVDVDAFVPSRPNHLPEDYARPPRLPEGPVLVSNTAHAINGGIVIDADGASTVAGLYAAGEVSAGPHGADRLGGGMVTNCQVFGARAGRAAAAYARSSAARAASSWAQECLADRLSRLGHGDHDPHAVLADLQRVTENHLMVRRSARGLQTVLECVAELGGERVPHCSIAAPPLLRRTMEVENSILTAQAMAAAALAREESRGSHFREDYAQRDDKKFGNPYVLRIRGGTLYGQFMSLGAARSAAPIEPDG